MSASTPNGTAEVKISTDGTGPPATPAMPGPRNAPTNPAVWTTLVAAVLLASGTLTWHIAVRSDQNMLEGERVREEDPDQHDGREGPADRRALPPAYPVEEAPAGEGAEPAQPQPDPEDRVYRGRSAPGSPEAGYQELRSPREVGQEPKVREERRQRKDHDDPRPEQFGERVQRAGGSRRDAFPQHGEEDREEHNPDRPERDERGIPAVRRQEVARRGRADEPGEVVARSDEAHGEPPPLGEQRCGEPVGRGDHQAAAEGRQEEEQREEDETVRENDRPHRDRE
jgi:hypothetical protein